MIELREITKKFDHRAIAGLHGINLDLKSAEVLAVMGPNGSGKSTLVNIISEKLKPDTGSMKIEGVACLFDPGTITQDINVQKFLLSQVTISSDEEKKIQLTRDLADIFEFTFQLRQKTSELSAGQKQKVLLAAALINRPALLLLDEPFIHLDPQTRKEILNSLFSYIRNHETSVLWVTHDLEDALKHADRVGILNFGKMEQIATPLEVVLNPRNLFVAKFLGYENFVTIKKTESGWDSPWGVLKLPCLNAQENALLVIPSHALSISDSGLSVEACHFYLQGLERRLEVLWGERKLTVKINLPAPLVMPGQKVFLTLRAEQCLIIPL